ncbi:MAG: hypothetical protein ACI38Y_01680 [Candidatus Methanomethylophilaceae archaeon]
MTSCTAPNREENLESGIRSFLSDRGNDMVAGIRRMGRDALVDRVMEVASDMGLDCHLSDDAPSDAEIVLFRHWQDMDIDGIRVIWPDSDIIFGQDLCHQVPAVVRLR